MNSFDLSIFNSIHALSGKFFLLDWLFIFIGNYLAYFLVLWILILLLKEKSWSKKWYVFSWMAIAGILSRGIITEVIRFFYARPRPFVALGFDPLIKNETSGSFPSGHMAFYAALILPMFLFGRKVGIWYTIAVVLMGIGRIYGGVHWPTDILGGIILGLLVSYLIKLALPDNKTQKVEIEKTA